MSGVAIFNSAVSQLQNQQHNLFKIREARKKMEYEEEDRAFKRKKNAIDLESAERSGEMSGLQVDAFRAQTKAYEKQQDEISKGFNGQIKLAEHQAKTTADKALNWAKIAYKSDPQGVSAFLQATQANDQRKQMIVPEFSYGKVGYRTKDIKQPDAEKPEYTRKDVVAQAQRMAGNGVNPTDEHLARAEELLSGKQAGKREPSAGQGNGVKKQNNDKIKMRFPDGRTGSVTKDKVEEAKRRGAVLI